MSKIIAIIVTGLTLGGCVESGDIGDRLSRAGAFAMARDNPMGAAAMSGAPMYTSYCQPVFGQPGQFSCVNY